MSACFSLAAHISCLQLSPDLAAIVMTYPWECIECKSCAICSKSDNEVRHDPQVISLCSFIDLLFKSVGCVQVCAACLYCIYRTSSCSVTTVIGDITCSVSDLLLRNLLKVIIIATHTADLCNLATGFQTVGSRYLGYDQTVHKYDVTQSVS